MFNVIAVFLGGGLGSVLRYLTNLVCPFPTVVVNITGSFIIGFFYVFFMDKADISSSLKLAITVGICGGLTTFSTFSLELFKMIEKGGYVQSLGYIILSVLICLLSTGIGAYLAKNI